MHDDVPQQTQDETDAVTERIFSEWDKWFDNPPDKRKEGLSDMQNELRGMYDTYVTERNKPQRDVLVLAELGEQMMVLDKKMRQTKNNLMQELWK